MWSGGPSGQPSTSTPGDETTGAVGGVELAGLRAAVESLSVPVDGVVPVDGDVLAELLGLADRLQARIHGAVAVVSTGTSTPTAMR